MADQNEKFREFVAQVDPQFTEGPKDEDPEETFARAQEELRQALDVNSQKDVLEFEMPAIEQEQEQEPKVRRTAGPPYDEGETPVEKKDPWSRQSGRLGKISVDESEMQVYWDALFSDSRLVLPIPMQLGERRVVVRVRSLTVAEKEVIALATNQIALKYPIQSIDKSIVIANYAMQAGVVMQVESVDGQPFRPFEALPAEGVLPEDSGKAEELAQVMRLRLASMHQSKLRMLIDAVHIFEVKQAILEDGSINQDFPVPADTN
jgi:hypothetical protein